MNHRAFFWCVKYLTHHTEFYMCYSVCLVFSILYMISYHQTQSPLKFSLLLCANFYSFIFCCYCFEWWSFWNDVINISRPPYNRLCMPVCVVQKRYRNQQRSFDANQLITQRPTWTWVHLACSLLSPCIETNNKSIYSHFAQTQTPSKYIQL